MQDKAAIPAVFLKPIAFIPLVGAVVFAINLLVFGADRALEGDSGLHISSAYAIRDYLLEGFGENPARFLSSYYEHTPALGIGLWPPVYHGLLGLWLLIFPFGVLSVQAFSALIVAIGSFAVFSALKRFTDTPVALFSALVFITIPAVLLPGQATDIDVLAGLVSFLAALQLYQYFQRPEVKGALLFSLLAITALLTKGNAGGLVIFGVIAFLSCGQWRLLKQWHFWSIPLLIIAIAGPWYLLTTGLSSQGFRYGFGPDYWQAAIPGYFKAALVSPGLVCLGLLVLGFFTERAAHQQKDAQQFWRVMISFAIGWLAFTLLVPAAIQTRYLSGLFFVMPVMAAPGIAYLSTLVRQGRALYALAVLAILPLLWHLPVGHAEPDWTGSMVTEIRSELDDAPKALLLAVGPAAEPVLLARLIATRPSGRAPILKIRGSKLLGGGGYNNHDYEPKFQTPEDAVAELNRFGVPYVVIERSTDAARFEHNEQLAAYIAAHPDDFEMIARLPFADGVVWLVRNKMVSDEALDTAAIRVLNRNEKLHAMAARF